ncbi:GNAT family N-acetyltransferase [Polaribacter vadi]|uniref:GNAT family N-acetyltransferase n=1 Tax=Polaribacter TaxID=52959 RepID=UPI001C08DA2B|nr:MULTISPECIES: GNAT family N-acetyltransferase [Polaribacter]MBU3012162.1 GNAT family N-acetyltransferase [Polaribacter vadi]MDO6741978.1 GNAT family N-acetyltransferase [Polaribacter sp. 1_MG-2023]
MIEIRRATENDATYIALLGRITYTESHGDYIENKKNLLDFYNTYYAVSQIKKELNDINNLFWIVFSDELPIGFAKLCLNVNTSNLEDKNYCKLQRLYILNDFIGFKIGTQLQDIILKKAVELNYKKIWLTAYYKNTKGIKFYKRYDFKKVGSIDFYVGETNYENLIFEKKL